MAADLHPMANEALDGTIGDVWYILFGSTVAFVTSSFVNNLLNHALRNVFSVESLKHFALRSCISTSLAQFVDNLIFAFIVSAVLLDWTPVQCVACAITGALFEVFSEMVFIPLGYRICAQIKRKTTA